MKTVIYSLIAIFLFGTIATAFMGKQKKYNTILIESIDKNASSELLNQSANIIGKRLKAYSSDKFEISVNHEQKKIQVSLVRSWNLNAAARLILQKGKLEFYEAYNYKDVTDILKKDTALFSLLNDKAKNDISPRLGCASSADIARINALINFLQLNQICKFAWSGSNNNSFCLYALKLENGKGALISGSYIESIKRIKSPENGNELEITFKNTAVILWADITKRNIGKSIAMVLDGNVLSAPIVRDEINGGHSQITGDFSKDELDFIVSVISYGELPLDFQMVE